MVYRQQELLQALVDHQKGMTTRAMFDYCKTKPGSEIPDVKTAGRLVLVMREAGLLVSELIEGIQVHTITPKGNVELKKAIAAENGEEFKNDEQLHETVALDVDHRAEPAHQVEVSAVEVVDVQDHHDPVTLQEQVEIQVAEQQEATACSEPTSAESVESLGIIALDPADPVDAAVIPLVAHLRELSERHVAIDNKDEKIGVLQELMAPALLSNRIKTILGEIIGDLQNMEAA